MNINLEELREAVKLMQELERIAEKISPVLESLNKLGGKNVIIPPATDRFIERGEVCKILKVGSSVVSNLINQGTLTPLYIASSNNMKFRLSEVEKIPLPNNRDESKPDKRVRQKKA